MADTSTNIPHMPQMNSILNLDHRPSQGVLRALLNVLIDRSQCQNL